jgi:uncharacterized membrane protein HdeD (DUF308 family)
VTLQQPVSGCAGPALAAGACIIAASIWRSAKSKSWLLVLNGLALSAYGLMTLFWHGPLSFGFFALLLVVMAMTFGILALAIARTLRRPVADEWFFGLAGGVGRLNLRPLLNGRAWHG